jgi:hypothetical protein
MLEEGASVPDRTSVAPIAEERMQSDPRETSGMH